MTYFNLSTDIVDRTDLTINEKMACVVMARYANRKAFEGLLSTAVIAQKMGVSEAVAQQTLDKLAQKGLLVQQIQDSSSPHNKATSHVASTRGEQNDILDDIADLFDEVVSRAQLKILFGLAGQDATVLKNAYFQVKARHDQNVIEILAEYLQTGKLQADEQQVKAAPDLPADIIADRPITEQESAALFEALEVDEVIANSGRRINNQINMSRVKSLYKANKKT